METILRLAAGNKHMAVGLERLFQHAQMAKKRMVLCAIQSAEMVTTVLAQFAGRTVQMSSEMTEHSVTSLHLMEEVQVRSTNAMIAKNGVHSGTLSVEKTSTTLHVAYVHLIAHLA